jgi:uncharacterized membrane protein (UPF0127 family)
VQKAFLSPILRKPDASLVLLNARTGIVLAYSLASAFDSKTRRSGLLGRDRLEEGHALIIAPTNAVHTFFMRFAIDVVFVRKDGLVVRAHHAVKPWRIAGALRGHAAIELPAGTLANSDTVRGDQLVITTPPQATMF